MCVWVVAWLPQSLKWTFFEIFSTLQISFRTGTLHSKKFQKKPVEFSFWGKQCIVLPHFSSLCTTGPRNRAIKSITTTTASNRSMNISFAWFSPSTFEKLLFSIARLLELAPIVSSAFNMMLYCATILLVVTNRIHQKRSLWKTIQRESLKNNFAMKFLVRMKAERDALYIYIIQYGQLHANYSFNWIYAIQIKNTKEYSE